MKDNTTAEMADENKIRPFGTDRLNKSFADKKGYYLIGFTTNIKKATERDKDLALTYGLNLVSDFHDITQKLLSVQLKNESNTLTSSEKIYYDMLS